jgi:hypothetical protein
MAPSAVGLLFAAACQAAQPAVVTPPPFTPAAARTQASATQTGAVAVAVPVGSPTATPPLVGDYRTLVRSRVEVVQQSLGKLEQHLGLVQQSPVRMSENDWRAQMQLILDESASANEGLKVLGARGGADAALYAEVSKVVTDVDFVVGEYRMAFDFDPDGTHLLRAGRAEKSTADEVESIRLELQRQVGFGASPTPAR